MGMRAGCGIQENEACRRSEAVFHSEQRFPKASLLWVARRTNHLKSEWTISVGQHRSQTAFIGQQFGQHILLR